MSCTSCHFNWIQENLVLDKDLYEESHGFASIMRCDDCSSIFIEYWVEIFDDGWMFWVEVQMEELDEILLIKNNQDIKYKIIDLIRKKREVICKGPSNNYTILPGTDCLLDGPPW